MSGADWIRMRSCLFTHPKVLQMTTFLSTQWPFFNFVCVDEVTGGEISGWDTGEQRCVTDYVTRTALRFVTISGLLALWSSARSHSDDGILRGIAISDLDDMAGIPCFGLALQHVGWATYETEAQTVILPNFSEWNYQGKPPPKTNAERQKEWRKRNENRNENSNGKNNENVTVQSREEKRREEKKIDSAIEEQSHDSQSQSHNSNGQSKKHNRHEYSPEFLAFWNAYPRFRRTGKGAAYRAWQVALRNGADPGEILQAVTEYAQSPVGSGEFSKMPQTWLTGRCWEDDREAWQGNAQRASKCPTDEDLANWNPITG